MCWVKLFTQVNLTKYFNQATLLNSPTTIRLTTHCWPGFSSQQQGFAPRSLFKKTKQNNNLCLNVNDGCKNWSYTNHYCVPQCTINQAVIHALLICRFTLITTFCVSADELNFLSLCSVGSTSYFHREILPVELHLTLLKRSIVET